MTALRPELEAIFQALMARSERVLELDVIADEIGTAAVTAHDIDALFTALEARGRVVGNPSAGRASAHLRQVLESARELKRAHGRTPTPQEIAAHSGLGIEDVRLSLWFAKIVQR
jgi:hypothetical protein